MTKKYFIAAAILCTIIGSKAYGQNNKPDPIDVALQSCLDSTQNQTTVGMESCEIRARDAWDREMNKYYKLLMSVLSPDEKDKLKKSQINWLAFRDAENTFSGTMYNDMQGTMWVPVSVDAQLQLIKHRTLELKSYYDSKSEQ